MGIDMTLIIGGMDTLNIDAVFSLITVYLVMGLANNVANLVQSIPINRFKKP